MLAQLPLLRFGHLPSPVVVQLHPERLQTLGDELALAVELLFGDLPRHVEPDSPVLLHLDLLQLPLRNGDVLVQPAVVRPGVHGLDAGDDNARVLQHLLDLAPHQRLKPLCPDVGALPALHALVLHPVAPVVSAWRVELVPVDLAVALGGLASVGPAAHEVPALGTPDQMLEEIEYLAVAARLAQTAFLGLLSQVPDLLVHRRREGHPDPLVLRTVVPPRPVLGRDVAALAEPPGALIGFKSQYSGNGAVVPSPDGPGRGDALGGQLLGDGRSSHVFADVHAKYTADDLGLGLHNLRPAALAELVPEGDVVDRDAALLGRAPLAHRRPLPEVVQLDLADGRHKAEGLHVDGVQDGFELYLVRLDHLHEGGGRVHAPAKPVGLPADDGVEAATSGVCQHPLEFGAILRPSSAHLLVARGDGQPPALAVGLHVGYLLGDGGLVLGVLALVRDAGVDGRPFRSRLPIGDPRRHACLLSRSLK